MIQLITNRKTALIVLSVFVCTMVLLPGFTGKAIAEDIVAQSNTSAGTAGASEAGTAGGESVFAGISIGTKIALTFILVSALIQFALSSSSGASTSTSHH